MTNLYMLDLNFISRIDGFLPTVERHAICDDNLLLDDLPIGVELTLKADQSF